MPPFRVALLVQTASHWSRELLLGVGSYAQEHGGWEFWVEARGFHEQIEVPDQWSFDGIICRLNHAGLEKSIRQLALPAINVSWLGGPLEHVPKVVSDEAECATLAAKFFLDKGFSNAGFVGPRPSLGYTTTVFDVFQRVARSGGMAFVENFNFPRDVEIYDLKESLSSWLRRLPKPAGIFTWSTQEASEVIDACRTAGLLVPDEVAVLALEYDPLISSLSPIAISSIDQQGKRVGYQAAAALHQLMLNRSTPQPDAGKSEPATRPGVGPRSKGVNLRASAPSKTVPAVTTVGPAGIDERLSTDTVFAVDPLVEQAVRMIRVSADLDLQVAELARRLDVSRRSLEYRFRKALKRTPADEIRRAKLKRLKALLSQSALTLEQITYAAGFHHHEAMIRFFKRETSLRPSEYRSMVALQSSSASGLRADREHVKSGGPKLQKTRSATESRRG